MLEVIVYPKEARRRPWEMIFVGLLYSSLSFLIVNWIFAQDVVLSRYSGLLVVMFSVLFSITFIYYSIRLDERRNIKDDSEIKAIYDDWKILSMFLYLFVGFIIGFTFWQVIIPSHINFNSQIETYCVLNNPLQYENCLDNYKINETIQDIETKPQGNFFSIFSNNVYVAIFTLVFALVFGAGVIFLISWNASVVSSVIALSIKYKLSNLPLGLTRFLVHGIPEIAGYFIVAMAGGMTSIAISNYLRKKISKDNLLKIIQRSSYLLIIGIIVLAIASLIEIYITPVFF